MISKIKYNKVILCDILTYLDERVELDDFNEYTTIIVKRRHGGLEERERLFGHQIKTKKQFKLVPGSFIISRVQCWHQAYAMVPDKIPLNMIASTNYDQFAISPQVDAKYFWWFSHSPYFTQTVRSSAVGVVIEKMVFKRDKWLTTSIPLPPLSEQRQIVAKIEQLAAKIEEALSLRHEAIIETEAFSKSIELVLFQKLLKDHPQESLKDLISLSSGEQLNKTELGDSYEFAVYGGGGYVGRYHRYLFEEPKIGIGRVGARCGCIYMTEPKAWITDNSLYVKEYSGRIEMDYLLFALKSLDLRRQANQSAQPVISQKRINPLKIPVPPNHEQRIIVDYINSLQQKVYKLKRKQEQTADELDALLLSILDKAFKGEL